MFYHFSGLVSVRSSGVIGEQTKILDRETRSSYVYRISAGDNSFQSATATLSITISDTNDNTPFFINAPYTFSINENAAPQAIGTVSVSDINPLVTNGHSHSYLESTFIDRGNGSIFFIFISFFDEIHVSNVAVSHLGLFCLPMSHKKDARLIWVKPLFYLLINRGMS